LNIKKLSSKIEAEIIEFRRKMHSNPELSLKEKMTTELIEESLKKYGIEYSRLDMESGLEAIIRGEKKGKTIALRADIDALPIEEETGLQFKSKNPGVMHACGHDIHTAVLLGAAAVLNNFKEQISGNIKFLFQPAEEVIGGAKEFIKNGVLKEPAVDAVIGLHTWPELKAGEIGYKSGAFMASTDEFVIYLKGKGGHAAHPDQCVDPIMISASLLTKLQTIVSRETSPTEPAVITAGTINAGTASNVIPEKVEITGTIRTVSEKTRQDIIAKMKRTVELTAESMGGSAVLKINKGTPPLVCSRNLTEIIKRSAEEVLGCDKVIELSEPSMGGDDFSFYTEHVPGGFFRLGTASDDPRTRLSLHNSGIVFDEKSIITGIMTLSRTALNFFD